MGSGTMKKVMIILFVGLLAFPWLMWYGIGKMIPGYQAMHHYDLKENRNIYDLDDGLENFFNDRIPYRTYLVHNYNRTKTDMDKTYKTGLEAKLIGALYHEEAQTSEMLDDIEGFEWLVYGDHEDLLQAEDHIHMYYDSEVVPASTENCGYTVKTCNVCGKTMKTDFTAKLVDTMLFPLDMNENFIVRGRNDWLFLFDWQHMYDLYIGKNHLKQADLDERTDIYGQLSDLCEQRGIQFEIIVCPAKYQVYDEYMPTMDIIDENKRMPRLMEYYKENTDIKACYPIEELEFTDRYAPTYFRYDSHWNQVGGYIGTQVLYKELGLPTTPLCDVEITRDESKMTECTDLVPMSGSERSDFASPDYNYVINYREGVEPDGVPGEPIWEMKPVQEVENATPQYGENVLLIGDSARSQLVPYISKDFSKTSVYHFYCMDPVFLNNSGYDSDQVKRQMQEDFKNCKYFIYETTESNEDSALDFARQILWLFQEVQ